MKRQTLAFILLLITILAWPTLSGGGQAVSAAALASNPRAGVALSGNDHSRDSIDLSGRILNLLNAGALQAACTPLPAATRIMPLGDSITHGTYGSGYPDTRLDSQVGGYRLPLYAGLRNAGYSVDFVGSVVTGNAYSNFDFQHEGHRGRADDYIADRIYGWLVNAPAEVILLHIGTNNLDEKSEDVEEILDEINRYEQDSSTSIITIVARIINRVNHSNTTTQFNNNVEAMVNARGDSDIFMVNMETGAGIVYSFSASGGDMADNLHPFARGYQKMANKWLGEINTLGLTSCLLPPLIHVLPDATASVGQPFTYPVLASGNPAPIFELIVKPSGMTIDPSTGVISWTPTTAGTANVTVQATNSQDSNQASFTITVSDAPAAPVVEPIANQEAVVGQPFIYDVNASGNPTPTFSLVAPVPVGMTINSTTGVISWTPVTVGLYNVTVRATNSEGSNNKSFTITVLEPPAIAPIADQEAIVAQPFTYDVEASGSPAPTFSLLAPVPTGMTINSSTGVINWTPATAGPFNVTVRATNSAGSDDESFTITVTAGPTAPVIAPIINQNIVVNTLFNYDVNASGSPAPAFSLVAPVPAGMAINSTTGLISWAPFATGTFNVTVRATNSAGSDDESFTITVTATSTAPAVTPIPDQNTVVNTLFTYDVNASGSPTPTFSLVAPAPAGMNIDPSSGLISWAPFATGTFNVTVRATNSEGTDDESFIITVTEGFLLFLPLAIGN